MYHLQTQSSEEETWKDLIALNYSDSLQLMNKEKPEDDKESHEAPLVKPEIDEV
jgi:hypothetical protein